MNTISNNDLLAHLSWRYATKKFDATKKISESDATTLLEVLRLAPSSYGLQPWKFIVVQNPELRKELRAVSWNQGQVTDCSHFVVFTTRAELDEAYVQKFIASIAESRKLDVAKLKDYQGMIVENVVKGMTGHSMLEWTRRQGYIAMGSLLQAAALKGIDACPMEGLDTTAYDKLLAIQDSPYRTVAAVALGYRAQDDASQNHPKVRFPSSEVLEIRS
jgi:nitroreductase